MLSTVRKPPSLDVTITTSDDLVPEFYRTFRCDGANITDDLTAEVPNWTPRNPVLIDAPPGKGKTHFANQVLLETAKQAGKNVLFLVNRVGLAEQQKVAIMDVLDSPWKDCLTAKGIREIEDLGMARVMTYHRLNAFARDPANEALSLLQTTTPA